MSSKPFVDFTTRIIYTLSASNERSALFHRIASGHCWQLLRSNDRHQFVLHFPTSALVSTRTVFFKFIIMAAVCSRCGHSILPLWFLLSFFLLFSLAYSQRSQIRCLLYFHTSCGLSANLECMCDMLHAARRKYRTQKLHKKSPSAHHRITLSGYIFATKAYIN